MDKLKGAALFFVFILLSACGTVSTSVKYAVKPKTVAQIKRIAVLNFKNNSNNRYAAGRARDFVSTALLQKGFDVAPQGQVDREAMRVGLRAGMYFDPRDLHLLAEALKVQGFVAGSVDQYKIERRGMYTYPIVSLTLRIINPDGKVVWQASGIKNGYSTLGRIFGLKSEDAIVLLQELIYDMTKGLSVKKQVSVKPSKKSTLTGRKK